MSAHGGCTGDDAGTHASGGRSSQQGSAAAYTQTPANAPCMTLSVTLVADLEKQHLTRFLVVDLKNKTRVLLCKRLSGQRRDVYMVVYFHLHWWWWAVLG